MKITIELSTGKKIELTDKEYEELSGMLRVPVQIYTAPNSSGGFMFMKTKPKETPYVECTYDDTSGTHRIFKIPKTEDGVSYLYC